MNGSSQKRLKKIGELSGEQQLLGTITRSKDQKEINIEIQEGKSILEKIFNNDEYDIEQLICRVQCKRKKLSNLRNLYAHKYNKIARLNLSMGEVESILSWYKKIIENIILWGTAAKYHNDTPSSTDIKDHVRSILDLILTGSSKEIYEAKNCSKNISYDDWRENLIAVLKRAAGRPEFCVVINKSPPTHRGPLCGQVFITYNPLSFLD